MENLDENSKKERSLMLGKKLVELRMKKATRQKFKPDEFSKTKKELAQLLTPEETLDKSKTKNTPDSTPMGS